jgi:hypothetical protein
MPGTALGLFLIDFIVRPFARIYEKWPLAMLLFLLVLYGIIGYIVIRSAYMADKRY